MEFTFEYSNGGMFIKSEKVVFETLDDLMDFVNKKGSIVIHKDINVISLFKEELAED